MNKDNDSCYTNTVLYQQHPFTCVVPAPTKAGKTTFVSKLISHAQERICPPPKKIIWCYAEWQSAYDPLPATVQFQHGLPEDLPKRNGKPTLIVLYDPMSEAKKDESIMELFPRGCHH